MYALLHQRDSCGQSAQILPIRFHLDPLTVLRWNLFAVHRQRVRQFHTFDLPLPIEED